MLDPVRLVEALAEDRAGLLQDRLRDDLGSAVALIARIAGREVLTIQASSPTPHEPGSGTVPSVAGGVL